jgi:diadenosine tetraphosphate (Ap4A) HIT family hydrolase
MADMTVFERIWNKPDEHLFLSERHGVMAAVDAFPRMPLQSVVAPQFGTKGQASHFNLLPTVTKRKLLEVADAVGQKILQHCTPEQRVITHIEGYGIDDHAHIVLFAAERKQGANLYIGETLGPIAVQHTLETIRFSPTEAEQLEARLDDIN